MKPVQFPLPGLMACLLLSACVGNGPRLDWDLRGGAGFDTTAAAQGATNPRPSADSRGVISYPGYQVAVARQGDTVVSMAARIGTDAGQLASYNALRPSDSLRAGEVLAIPGRVAEGAPMGTSAGAGTGTGGIIGSTLPAPGTASPGKVDVTTIAGNAIDRSTAAAPAATPQKPQGGEPIRHKVQRGETAFTIARAYNVSAKALADWNGLGSDMAVREGQYLMIPTAASAPLTPEEGGTEAPATTTAPGVGSPTPTPPSAAKPLPDEKTAPAAEAPKETPPAPDLGSQRSAASSAKLVMPVAGKIIRGYKKKVNDGIDIAAAAGTAVKAADAGTVAAVTKDTSGTPIVVIRHANNLLTVYAGVDAVKVTKGATVTRGQAIAVVRSGSPAFLHFEVRNGVDSVDPMPYLQ